jgi:hypothetical protein
MRLTKRGWIVVNIATVTALVALMSAIGAIETAGY